MRKQLLKRRTPIILGIQVAIVLGAYLLAYGLRFDFSLPAHYWQLMLSQASLLLAIKLLVFWRFDLFHGWWRYVSMADLLTIFKANLAASVLFVLFQFFFHPHGHAPRSVLILDGIFCFLLMGGVRFATRAFRENYLAWPWRSRRNLPRLLIVGAGQAGQAIAKEVRQNPQLGLCLAGFVDDDPLKQRQNFQGFKVLGTTADLESLCQSMAIDRLVIAIPSASRAAVQALASQCLATGIKFQTLPSLGEIIGGQVSIKQVRDVSVDDLLGRDPAVADAAAITRYLTGKVVLVTGAAGSIGSEICRQVARFGARRLILLDHAESPLFHIERELRELSGTPEIVPVLGDMRNRAKVVSLFAAYRPEVVFHAAAYKHVPMIEAHPAEAIDNNIRGMRVVADAAHDHGAEGFVLISTDKAVNPTSVMGATKRAAELYVQALNQVSKTRFVTVRFGNVLESAGSVLPVFREQIARGGPVKVTHPDITRYFMTIPEATQLVLETAAMGKGGEVFYLDMGEPVPIARLAEDLIRLSGFVPHKEIEIIYTGLRPGEKLYEELVSSQEGIGTTTNQRILVALRRAPVRDLQGLEADLEQLYQVTRDIGGASRALNLLRGLVPEYTPTPNH